MTHDELVGALTNVPTLNPGSAARLLNFANAAN